MFFIITVFFILGIFLASFISLDLFYFYLLLLICVVLFVCNLQNKKFKFIMLASVFLFLGYARFNISQLDTNAIGSRHISYYNDQKIELFGIIVDEPDKREDQIKYTIGQIIINQKKIKGKLLITTRLYPRFNFADQVKIIGRLKKPEPFDGFFYDQYLAKQGIYSLCYYPKASLAQKRQSLSWDIKVKKQIFKIKNKFIVQIEKILPRPHSGLLAGLLLGETSGMPEYLNQAFIDTGTVHIVAISGYNITIIITLFLFLAPYFYLSRKRAWLIIIPSLLFFVIITGAEASIVRAAIMGLIAALATESGRISDVKRLLLITAVIMLAINPMLLRFDVGFQLSFLATLGLVYIVPRLEKALDWFLARWSKRHQVFLNKIQSLKFSEQILCTIKKVIAIIRESAITTISANLAVAPLLLYQFGRISLISPIVNVLILWIIPVTMALGFIAVLISFIFLPLGQILACFVWLFLEYIIETVKFF